MQWNFGRAVPWLLALASAGVVAAQDPPARVARIAYITGQVSFEPATVDQWAAASLNYPMTTGDNLYTDNGARAELRIGRNAIRLNYGTNFQFVNLNDQVAQVSINSGSVNVRVRQLADGSSWEIDTPNGAVTILQPGEYRVDCDPDRNATMVTVRGGDTEVTENNQSFPVHAGQTAYFGADGQPQLQDQNPEDEFDSFATSRDRLQDAPPPRYVSQDMDGYEDFNTYGTWQADSEYGPIWYPRVSADWAPYHTGHWAWVEPWGWTWVDDEPWGFAPFHYGRWAYVNGAWGWTPGPVGMRPVYAPALVAFVGGGSGFGLSIGVGGGLGAVAWFALGPRDPYIPPYHVSDAYVRNVNITNTRITNINVTNIRVENINYMNRSVPGAAVAVPQAAFASAQPVQRSSVKVNAAQMQQARVIGTAPQVVPQRASVLASARSGPVAAPPARLASRPVVARLAPPPAPVSFAAKQQLLQQHPGTPVAPQQIQALQRQSPAAAATSRFAVKPINTSQVHTITPAPRAAVPQSQRTFGQPAAPARPAQTATPSPTPRTFGQPTTPAQAQPRYPQSATPAQTQPRTFGQPTTPAQTQPRYPQSAPPVQTQPRNVQPVTPAQTQPRYPQSAPPVQTQPRNVQPVTPAQTQPRYAPPTTPAQTQPRSVQPAPPARAQAPAVQHPAPAPQTHPQAAKPAPQKQPPPSKTKEEKEKEKQ